MPIGKKRIGLFGQMVLLMLTVLSISLLLVIVFFSTIIDDWVEKTTERHALTVATLVAEHEGILDGLATDTPSQSIQPIAEALRRDIGADYVVITDDQGNRYSHPRVEEIGNPTETSNAEPLAGRPIVFIGDGVLGEAVKAKVPIYGENQEVIGVSSVGFLTDELREEILFYQLRIASFGGLGLLIGIPGAFFIARRVKRMIFDLEPEEIAQSFLEKQVILNTIQDATIAVGTDFRVMSVNPKANVLLQLEIHDAVEDVQLKEIVYNRLENDMDARQERIVLDDAIYLVDTARIETATVKMAGVVLTIRPFSEIEHLANELLEIRQQSEIMRAQTHEYLNKLNTINGLLLLDRHDEAKAMIQQEVEELQQTITFLTATVKDPLVVAVLLGKVNRAKEMKVSLTFDQESTWLDYPDHLQSKHLVTVIGNVVDNALEAVFQHRGIEGIVHVSYTDFGDELIMDIEDNGKGMTEQESRDYMLYGHTSKRDKNHGLGFTIVQHALQTLNGTLYQTRRESDGMRMTIAIPKRERGERHD